MPTISEMFAIVTQAVSAFISTLGTAITSVTQLFWTTGESAGPTFLGMLLLVSLGAGLVFLGFNLIRGLIRRIRG